MTLGGFVPDICCRCGLFCSQTGEAVPYPAPPRGGCPSERNPVKGGMLNLPAVVVDVVVVFVVVSGAACAAG